MFFNLMNYITSISLILFLFLLNCSGMKEVKDAHPEIKILEINSWLNLMPGGPGSFHLSGELAVHLADDDMIFDINISEISVYSNQELLYRFKPVLQYSRTEPDYAYHSGKIDVYQF